MFTGGAAVDVVAVALPLRTLDDRVPPMSCVYVALDDTADDEPDAVAFADLVLPETVLVKLVIAIVLPSKSEGTVAAGASPLDIFTLLPVIVTISTEVLSSCAIARLESHNRPNNGPCILYWVGIVAR